MAIDCARTKGGKGVSERGKGGRERFAGEGGEERFNLVGRAGPVDAVAMECARRKGGEGGVREGVEGPGERMWGSKSNR